MVAFSLEKCIKGFLKTANQQIPGQGITKSVSKFTKDIPAKYDGLDISISFGQGRATYVPWIAFTGYDQKIQQGIYPVYLYYKEIKILVLAYGVSAKKRPLIQWPSKPKRNTISEQFQLNRILPPALYGSSMVHKVYDTKRPLDFSQMVTDLDQILRIYHGMFTQTPGPKIATNEDQQVFKAERNHSAEGYEAYDRDMALSELFIDEKRLNEIQKALRNKKNVILQGPPGTGKTFLAMRLAYMEIGKKDRTRVQMIQFHQSYTYEDFIQGYRPNDTGGFALKSGIFFDFCIRAQRDPDQNYYFIIDEINRGNLTKILGESMMLLENDKREKKIGIPLTYAKDSADLFYIPPNLHLIGTMNTADRSLAMVDYALRRRFAFITLTPEFGLPFIKHLVGRGLPEDEAKRISVKALHLNEEIGRDPNLGSGFAIGHSYFCGSGLITDADWYNDIVNWGISDLLNEYWFDSKEKAKAHLKSLLE